MSTGCMKLMLTIVTAALVVSVWKQNAALLRSTRKEISSIGGFRRAKVGSDVHVMDTVSEPMPRDVTWHEPWLEVEGEGSALGELPPTVHYLWCGANRPLTFKHYLGVLSALRLVKPLQLVFHFSHNLPVTDTFMYNDWFQELKDNVPFLDLRQLPSKESCQHDLKLDTILSLLSREGGLYLAENVVLTRRPDVMDDRTVWWTTNHRLAMANVTPDVVMVMPSIRGVEINVAQVLRDVRSGGPQCVTQADYKLGPEQDCYCVVVNPSRNLFPRDIWADSSSHFASLARWLFYGQRAEQKATPDVTRPIPRVTHYVKLLSSQYIISTLCVHSYILSALHVAGFQRVYLHVTHEPTGRWWAELRKENVTLVRLHASSAVFQQRVDWVKHVGDLARFNIVYKYGGAYQDFDTVWRSYLPDSLLAYPAVISPAISKNGIWPGGLSLGLFLARPGAPFLRHFLKTYRKYVRKMLLYNSVTMSYRTLERYPSTVRVEPRLQVICYGRWCHPHWAKPPVWDLHWKARKGYNWTHTHALHIPYPKPTASFRSPEALSRGKDMMADVGRHILRRSGRAHFIHP